MTVINDGAFGMWAASSAATDPNPSPTQANAAFKVVQLKWQLAKLKTIPISQLEVSSSSSGRKTVATRLKALSIW